MEFIKEFYDNFKGFSLTDINNAINSLNEQDKEALYRIYGVNGTKKINSKTARQVIESVRKHLIKKDLCAVLNADSFTIKKYFKRFKEEQIKTLLKQYSIDKVEVKEEVTVREKTLNYDVVKRLRHYIDNNVDINRSHDNQFYKPFFEVFNGYAREEVLHIMKYNSKSDNLLIYKKFGSDLSNIIYNPDLLDKENERINSVIFHVMKVRLASLKSGKTKYVRIEDLFPNINKEILISRLNKLNGKERNKLISRFGNDLSKECIIRKGILDTLVSDRMRFLLTSDSLIRKDYVGLYSSLIHVKEANDSIEEFNDKINNAFNYLTEEEILLLKKKYGKDFSNKKNDGLISKEEHYKIVRIIYKLRYYIKTQNKEKIKYKSFFDRFPEASRKEVLEAIERLQPIEKKILYTYYGENLDKQYEYGTFSLEIIEAVKRIVSRIHRFILAIQSERTGIYIKELRKVRNLVLTDEFKELLNTYNEKEALVILIKEKFNGDFSEDEIWSITGIDPASQKKLLKVK